jgi:hypothetical protein
LFLSPIAYLVPEAASQKMSYDDEQARHAALVEFVGIFEKVSSAPTNLSDLSDGVALFEALSEM